MGTEQDGLILASREKKCSGLMAECQEEERQGDRFWKSQRQGTLPGTREPEAEAPGETRCWRSTGPARLQAGTESVNVPDSAMQGSHAYARLKAPRNQAKRKLPKLESECKAGVTPQSKGQAGKLLQLGQLSRRWGRPPLPLLTASRLETCDLESTRESAGGPRPPPLIQPPLPGLWATG